MFKTDETRYYLLLQCKGFFQNVFCTTTMFTLENVLDGKKTGNLIGGGGGWGVEGGIRMSWVEKFRKINQQGWSQRTSVSDLRVVLFCREHFSFTARFFLLPQLTFFCRQIFSLAVTYFFFVARAFLLPGVFFFCLELYLFCREHFSFTGSFFLLP